ncbi:hypothetical protein F4805DRAFT_139897 [Annulohypoxylon moriforme]|nr:hypothetical protein F4805DRAFT_139897 [Annulohypoxylon moriforme]
MIMIKRLLARLETVKPMALLFRSAGRPERPLIYAHKRTYVHFRCIVFLFNHPSLWHVYLERCVIYVRFRLQYCRCKLDGDIEIWNKTSLFSTMPRDVFYFDPPGPCNYRAPWLTFPTDISSFPKPQRRKTIHVARRKTDSLEIPNKRTVEPLQKRKRPKSSHKPEVISLLSSDDEQNSRSHLVKSPRRSHRDRQVYKKRVSIEDVNKGMAAAKRLSKEATIQRPRKEEMRPALQEIPARQSLGVKRFGTYTNSFEIKNRKILVEMGIISPQRPRFSDSAALKNLTHDTGEWMVPHPASPNSPNSSLPPPSSFIPLDAG